MQLLWDKAHSTDYPCIYRARVVDNKDPQNIGRVKVVIPSLSGEDVEVWVRPISVFGYKSTHGSHVVPDIGCYVYVMFENGDIRFPVYFGGVVLEGQVLSESTEDGSQEKEYIILRSPKGSILKISDNKNKIILRTPSKHLIEIDDTEDRILIKTSNHTITISDSSKIEIECNGEFEVKASRRITLRAPSIRMLGSSPADVEFEGDLRLIGNLHVEGNITATGSIIDQGGNTNHHSH